MGTDIAISREIRRSIARMPEDATPSEKVLLRIGVLAATSGMTDERIKTFLIQLSRSL